MAQGEKIVKQRYGIIAPFLLEALKKRGYEPYYCETADEASQLALSLMPKEGTVSWGGSVTLEEMGLIEKVKAAGFPVIDRDEAKSKEERTFMMRQALLCDVYLSSVNAISEDGVMVNIDGTGNRIAAIAFGAKQVILLVGMNKLCRDGKAARERARTFAAPNNGVRLSLNLPCVKTGICHDCNGEDCMCSQIVEMRRSRIPGRIKVILVGESLGL